MKSIIIRLVFMGLVMGSVVFQGSSASAQEEMVNKTIAVTGRLVAVDLEKSTITVEKAIDDESEGANQVVLFVESSTIIEKAEEPITLADLVIEQIVAVEGMVNEDGNVTAWYIRME